MRGRVIILLVLIAVVVIVAVAALFLTGDEGDGEATPAPTTDLNLDPLDVAATQTIQALQPTPDGSADDGGDDGAVPAPPVDLAPVVIAQQDLPRGFRLTEEFLTGNSPAVGLALWPVGSVPQNSFDDVNEVANLLVRSDIPRESPILSTQLVADMTALGNVGSDAALLLPPGLVAVSMPLDPSGVGSVAYGLQHGDYVDIILSFLFIEVDETFQTRQPNKISVITRDEEGRLIFGGQLEGRPEPSTLSSLGVLVSPTENQRPRLVTQRTIERAYVLKIGYFPPDGRVVGVMSPTPFVTSTPDPESAPAEGETAQQSATNAPLPTATAFLPVIVTLGLEPQDALVLVWAIDAQIPITLALRSATDAGSTPTTAVTLQYLIETYSIPQPPILPFALEPAIRSLRTVQLEVFTQFSVDDQGNVNPDNGAQN